VEGYLELFHVARVSGSVRPWRGDRPVARQHPYGPATRESRLCSDTRTDTTSFPCGKKGGRPKKQAVDPAQSTFVFL